MSEQDPNNIAPPQEKPAVDPKTLDFIKRGLSQQPDLVVEYPTEESEDASDAKLAC